MRSLVVLKHAESVDRGYNLNWIDLYRLDGKRITNDQFISKETLYHLVNAALPLELPDRRVDKNVWIADPPLNSIGIITSVEVGRSLVSHGHSGDQFGNCIYCSPCLCCIETAKYLSYGMNCQMKIRVEFSLCNWRGQHRFAMPTWTTASPKSFEKLANIDKAYKTIMQGSDWKLDETLVQLAKRMRNFVNALEKVHEGKTALLVGHGSTIGAIDKALCPNRANKPNPLSWVSYFRNVPRLASTSYDKVDKGWQYQKSIVPPFPYFPNGVFDWNAFK